MVEVVKSPEALNSGDVMCKHYWIIEPANGPTSEDVCKKCDVKRVFSNTPTEFTHGNYPASPAINPESRILKSSNV